MSDILDNWLAELRAYDKGTAAYQRAESGLKSYVRSLELKNEKMTDAINNLYERVL